jgi:hypothetical protein
MILFTMESSNETWVGVSMHIAKSNKNHLKRSPLEFNRQLSV